MRRPRSQPKFYQRGPAGVPGGRKRACRFAVEPLEPRLLLSADLMTDGVADAMRGALDELADRIDSFVGNEPLFKTPIPTIVRELVNDDGTANTFAPTLRDLFSVSVEQNDDPGDTTAVEMELQQLDSDGNNDDRVDIVEFFRGKVVDPIKTFLDGAPTNAELVDFLTTGVGASDLAGAIGPLELTVTSVTDSSTASQVSFDLGLSLGFEEGLSFDLGLGADDFNIIFPADGTASLDQLEVAATLDFSFTLGVFSSGEAAEAAPGCRNYYYYLSKISCTS